jgi:benzoyl-CoA reductase/2-hydroxyglutaryl-CoA dehydratase subunit BcrC/BadD/HgdB
MNYSNNCAFSVSRMTDTDLNALYNAILAEKATRQKRREEKRAGWILSHYSAFMSHPNATAVVVDDVTVVAVYSGYNGIQTATARPVHGDVYDDDTGIAVAYAKVMGEIIPDYI